ncbi:hypothetical protein OIO90_003786 [Microbotryomycetes sp. JL221]|nr:hypothetical protein OIO90_003786 [Microbotryomycetes sp. JL221]
MAGRLDDGVTPPSPGYAHAGSTLSTQQDRIVRPTTPTRPEHVLVSVDGAASTSTRAPAVAPTPPLSPSRSIGGSRPTTPQPQFSEKYGGYGPSSPLRGKRTMDDSSAPLLSSSGPSSSRYRKSSQRSTAMTFYYLVAAVCSITVVVILLTRWAGVESPTAELNKHLTPYLPASVASFVNSGLAGGPSTPHPIVPLLTSAKQDWDSLVSGQSTTYDRAVKKYKSRYQMPPPPGFDRWFAFATQGRNHTLVDEYDSMMEDLMPFRELSPSELRRRTAELAQVPGISIVSIRNGVAQVHSKSGKWAPALAFQQMVEAFVRDLPDMDIAINERYEGRVLPRQQKRIFMADYGLEGDELVSSNVSDPYRTPSLKGFTADWKRDGTTWETFKRACETEAGSRRLVESLRSAEVNSPLHVQGRSTAKTDAPVSRRRKTKGAFPATRELTFQKGLDTAFDFCAQPSLHTLHSAFYTDTRSIEHLYPVFSPSKARGFSDILIPSNHHWNPSSEFAYEFELKKGRTSTPSDLDWEQKTAKAYWRGKVTRGADSPPGHSSSFQKQRLVKYANQASPDSERVLVAFDPKSASLSSVLMPLADANSAMTDIAMACDPSLGECSYLKSLGYRVEPPAPLSDAWKHKFVLDLDEVGFSPKFMALMESKSAVVKNSIQLEFWRDWIQPWKHFVPLSSGYSELHNIQAFFEGLPPNVNLSSDANGTSPVTQLTKPFPIPELPTNADGTPFDGDKALKDIADAGAEWKEQIASKGDMEAYVYRLMIEWASIIAPQTEQQADNVGEDKAP